MEIKQNFENITFSNKEPFKLTHDLNIFYNHAWMRKEFDRLILNFSKYDKMILKPVFLDEFELKLKCAEEYLVNLITQVDDERLVFQRISEQSNLTIGTNCYSIKIEPEFILISATTKGGYNLGLSDFIYFINKKIKSSSENHRSKDLYIPSANIYSCE